MDVFFNYIHTNLLEMNMFLKHPGISRPFVDDVKGQLIRKVKGEVAIHKMHLPMIPLASGLANVFSYSSR